MIDENIQIHRHASAIQITTTESISTLPTTIERILISTNLPFDYLFIAS